MVDEPQALSLASASMILEAFEAYQSEFKAITQRAKECFERRDWRAARLDAIERLELYKKVINLIVSRLQEVLCSECKYIALWSETKVEYSRLIACKDDFELAETFFNSVTRRIFTTVGVDARIEFVDKDFEAAPPRPGSRPGLPIFTTFAVSESNSPLPDTVREILVAYTFTTGYQDINRDARRVSAEIVTLLPNQVSQTDIERIEVLRSVFYRDNYAFIIGRIILHPGPWKQPVPLAISLVSSSSGVRVDAVLLDEDDVSIVFSFAHSYFHIEVERPYDLVHFLKSIIPLKRIAELYISIGYNKHGKTELYRDLMRHMASSMDKFEIARGEKGMVMAVFTLPSYDVVFKVIKDRVTPPKATSRAEVMERYDLVFKHDRVGRLVDAQQFDYLRFERERFTEGLLNELLEYAPSVVSLEDGCVVLKHLYTERRLTPLNLYIKEVPETAAANAVIDYGQAIKDLAAANVFPGDVLLKNFGVTRHGRVVFYDYDELCLVTDCVFRTIPQARDFDDEFAAEPWFYVGPMDIFPEEFRTFLGLTEPLRSIFIESHGDLFGIDFWRRLQARHTAGEVVETYPYPPSKHLIAP